mmetsp:Transcript_27622/g.60817  ORF Transcript_27622/g.60817 Transcript_27622/m.60817 type:complete len:381 (-) Transcript_27622:162-1304(-)|eukprot:CAMPEP_0168178982 /NCGR_PEP_ID=MMETSP0139_2-20121125/9522_1 /TAXON_ID=44445 /ORGANISM="Pseudo-nitzschia australis, Strain 10249 10 AB" /LENGTH=380 /DNA_ID=CAMNT_0008098625 /DNA_START=105 /DNA_END=1247 /DNA_ORIENTATION=+
MASSSIVRLGPIHDNLSAQLLRKAVISFFQKNDNDDAERESSSESNDDANRDSDSHFVIRNKYFSADIILKDIEMDQEKDETTSTSDIATLEDGVILVFDAVQSNPDRCRDNPNAGTISTFDSLGATHQKAISSNTCGDLLRLCVGVSFSELSPSELRGKDHEKEYSRRILWCLDNGYEYVEADLSEEGQRKGHDDRDKDGFARIIEAVQGTVWSSAAMSKSKSNTLKGAYADSKTTIQDDSSPKGEQDLSAAAKSETENTKDQAIEKNLYEPPDPSLLTATLSTQNDGDNVAAIFGLKEASSGTDPEDQETEKLFVEMESVLKEAAQIRQASKSGVLSDDERRERAGTAALALVNLMGQFGLDENDDDDSYGSDDSMVE